MRIFIALAIAFVLLALVEFYFMRKMSSAVRIIFPRIKEKKIKFWRNIFTAYINLFPAIILLYYGYIFASGVKDVLPPESLLFDALILFPFWIIFIWMFQSDLFFLIIELFKLIAYPLRKMVFYKSRKIESAAVLIIAAFFFVYIPIIVYHDYSSVEISKVDFVKEDLPEELRGLKIALISDLQADRYTNRSRLKNYVDKTNGTNPDLILIAGDLITGTPRYIDLAAESVGMLEAPLGVFSCVGDHDNWAYRSDNARSRREITDAIARYDVRMMNNDTLSIRSGNAAIGIAFVTNTYSGSVDSAILDSLAAALNGLDLKIFLTHQPRNFLINKAREHNFDLYLAGHTHGGQISFIFPFISISPTLIETNFVRGEFKLNDMLMVISPGLGMSLAPIRYNSVPGITLITIK